MRNLELDIGNIFSSYDYVSLFKNQYLEFKYEEGDLFFSNIAIKNNISGTDYFDLETPYGYAGPITNAQENESSFIKRALQKYRAYCLENNVVAEFIRLHPYSKIQTFGYEFDMFAKERELVLVDLMVDKEARWLGYKSNTRNILRKKLSGIQIKINALKPSQFKTLYDSTMKKNAASSFYYFKHDFFEKLFEMPGCLKISAEKNGEVISAALFLISGDFSYYFLSANSMKSYSYNLNYHILEKYFEYASKTQVKIGILGGGRPGSTQPDSLLKFKMKFSLETVPYFIGGIVHNTEKYNSLTKNTNKKMFLSYRY